MEARKIMPKAGEKNILRKSKQDAFLEKNATRGKIVLYGAQKSKKKGILPPVINAGNPKLFSIMTSIIIKR